MYVVPALACGRGITEGGGPLCNTCQITATEVPRMAATPNGLDSFELKLNFDADQVENALRVFGFDPDKGKPRKIWFGEVVDGLDGPDTLPLAARGIILRVRRKKKGGDVTVKLRGPDGCVDV